MAIRKINYAVIAPEVEQEIKDKYTKQETEAMLSDKVSNSRVLTDVPVNAKFTDTNTTYSEITTDEIDTGTSGTLKAITGRRIKYVLDKVQNWINSLTKADVGLSNVDNTSDLNKPISSATQTALNSKVDNSRVLADVPINAKFTDTIYTHPSNHPASMIAESATKRFVSDTEKTNWSNKWDYNESTIKAVKVNNASNADTVNGKTVGTNVPAGAKFTDTVYTHPTTSGNKHIPSGGSNGQYLKWSADGVAMWDTVAGGLELGETSTSAYRGDRGKVAYDHSQSPHAPVDSISKSNATLYTPTSDYNPATKKYVDDNSGLIIP